MSEFDQARAALKNLGVPDVDAMGDAEVNNVVSTLFGALVSFSGSLASGLKLPVGSVARLFHAFAEVLDPEDPDPVSAVVARLAEVDR